MHVESPRSSIRTKLVLHLKPPITNAHASGPELAARGVAHPAGRTRFVFRGRPPNPKPAPEAPCSGQREKPRTADDKQSILFRNRTKPREVTRTARACACTPARPPSARLPARSSSPAFHIAFRVVWCHGQSHGRGGSRIAVLSRARGSGTAPCRSSRPSMSPVLALLLLPW